MAGLIRKAIGRLAQMVDDRGGWFPIVREPYTGAWQQNVEVKLDTVMSNPTLFRCVSLISNDIAKMRLRLVQEDENGIWKPTKSNAFSGVVNRPNGRSGYQNRIQFFSTWMISKLVWGNTYVLKQRDDRNVVNALYILDPCRVKVWVTPDGTITYELATDNLAGIEETSLFVPASDIIHDRWNTVWHPLVGLSPITAAGVSAMQGIHIRDNSALFFRNGASPSGVLVAPGAISEDTAKRLKEYWEANYTGKNVGKVAVLGDGLKYERLQINAADLQLIEQLKMTAEDICTAFGVPAFMAGVGTAPLNNNVETLWQQYYAQALQIHIESIELCLDEGLELPSHLGTEFDLDDLLRMDMSSLVKALGEATNRGILSPNEARARLGYGPKEGGDTPYLQQQNFSLAALHKRDSQEDPFAKGASSAPAALPAPSENEPSADGDEGEGEEARALRAQLEQREAIFAFAEHLVTELKETEIAYDA